MLFVVCLHQESPSPPSHPASNPPSPQPHPPAQAELESSRRQAEDNTRRLGDELQTLQARKSADSASGGAVLEAAVKMERESKERALRDLEAARASLAARQAELDGLRASAGEAASLAALEAEAAQLRGERASLQGQLEAVSHHRQVLLDTCDKLERQIKAAADAQGQGQDKVQTTAERRRGGGAGSPSQDGREHDIDALRRSASRYRSRATAFEALSQHYKQGLMALYPSGAAYGQAHFACLDAKQGQAEWFEREVAAVQRAGEAETHALEGEVADLWGRLRQAQSFSSELSRRFEDTLQAQFRSLQGHTAEDMRRQLDFLSAAQQRAERELAESMQVRALPLPPSPSPLPLPLPLSLSLVFSTLSYP